MMHFPLAALVQFLLTSEEHRARRERGSCGEHDLLNRHRTFVASCPRRGVSHADVLGAADVSATIL